MTHFAPKKMNLLKLDFDEDTSTEDIKTYLTDICHFLKARDFYAQGIHPGTGQIIIQPNETDDKEVICDVDSETNHIKNFRFLAQLVPDSRDPGVHRPSRSIEF